MLTDHTKAIYPLILVVLSKIFRHWNRTLLLNFIIFLAKLKIRHEKENNIFWQRDGKSVEAFLVKEINTNQKSYFEEKCDKHYIFLFVNICCIFTRFIVHQYFYNFLPNIYNLTRITKSIAKLNKIRSWSS